MNRRERQRIKGLADALTDLRDWTADNLSVDTEKIERQVPPGTVRTNAIAERISQEWEKIERPRRMDYQKMTVELLGDSAWGPIASIIEQHNTQTARRLDSDRRVILDHVLSDDKLRTSLNMHGQQFGPIDTLRQTIGGLSDTLHAIVKEERNRSVKRLIKGPSTFVGLVIVTIAALLQFLDYIDLLNLIKEAIKRALHTGN